ncbi:hypothetical protein [Brevibacillus fulvus]|uniref:Uncharacterized protein n=1 Tax=Brevibacillus fulvus TaxID=1125967 RepID=A0A938Y5D8_9BACL|nr:hypothetical protein [Brevibacillus fulvus]MBM7591565.1 hypothetical protein [Brevibacillus fulvus]
MWLIVCLSLLLNLGQQQGTAAEQVELFDTDKERVVQTINNSAAFQQTAQAMLASITGRVMEISPSLAKAMIVKIPLAPPQHMRIPKESVEADITNVFVVMPKQGERKPWLLLHTTENDTILVEFSSSLDKLKKLLNEKRALARGNAKAWYNSETFIVM